ncbi:hypothetical protein LshimejAT787_0109750 [Lyophyllum shimeji]|uniref:Uncharacterized protein n=1 Tax=Lyophyllum shimeji TaxID=47721 RepID=A0A9P3UK60_LYOSH|nr:hypothetical protein LshimejAT787_0109750 [Lyophyllum shimeji]
MAARHSLFSTLPRLAAVHEQTPHCPPFEKPHPCRSLWPRVLPKPANLSLDSLPPPPLPPLPLPPPPLPPPPLPPPPLPPPLPPSPLVTHSAYSFALLKRACLEYGRCLVLHKAFGGARSSVGTYSLAPPGLNVLTPTWAVKALNHVRAPDLERPELHARLIYFRQAFPALPEPLPAPIRPLVVTSRKDVRASTPDHGKQGIGHRAWLSLHVLRPFP